MADSLDVENTDTFLPRKGKLRTVWLVALNHKLPRRDFEKMNLVQICLKLTNMQSTLSVYSLFLLGCARILERQVHFIYGDANKLVFKLKHILTDNKSQSANNNRITLPSTEQLMHSAFSPSINDLSFNIDCQYLPDSEFFSIEIENKYTVASPLDITLPEDNMSSINYSINESVGDYSFTDDQPLCGEDDYHSIDNESAILSDALQHIPITPQQLKSPVDAGSIGGFVSPLANVDHPSSSTPAAPVLMKKSVKRRLKFDKVTQFTEKKMKRDNMRTRMNTLGFYDKFLNKASSLKLLASPVNSLNVYSNSKLLDLWTNAVVTITNDKDNIEITPNESLDLSIEVLRGKSVNSYSNVSDNIALSYSDISLNTHSNSASNSIQDASRSHSRVKGSYLGTLGYGIGLLPPIPDLGGESDDDIPLHDYSYDDNYDEFEPDTISKSDQFYKNVLLPKMGQNVSVSFAELLPRTCSKHIASLTFMHILGFIQQGLLSPVQTVPYKNVVLKRGNNF